MGKRIVKKPVKASGISYWDAAKYIYKVGEPLYDAGVDAAKWKLRFEMLDGAEGPRLYNDLTQYIHGGSFGPELYGMAQNMMGSNIPARNIFGYVKMLGDVAMGDTKHMKDLTSAFSETARYGRLTSDAYNTFKAVGFDPLLAINTKTGADVSQLTYAMQNGRVSFQMLGDALRYVTSEKGMFYQGMNRYLETPGGKNAQFQGGLTAFKEKAGTDIAYAVSWLQEGGIWAMQQAGLVKTDPVRLFADRSEIRAIVNSITPPGTDSKLREQLIGDLKKKYPRSFGHISNETTNEELSALANAVIFAYDNRIKLSKDILEFNKTDKLIKDNIAKAAKLKTAAKYVKETGKDFDDLNVNDRLSIDPLSGVYEPEEMSNAYDQGADGLLAENVKEYRKLELLKRNLKTSKDNSLIADAYVLKGNLNMQRELWGKDFLGNQWLLMQQLNELNMLEKAGNPFADYKKNGMTLGSIQQAFKGLHTYNPITGKHGVPVRILNTLDALVHPQMGNNSGSTVTGGSVGSNSYTGQQSAAITGGGTKQVIINIKSLVEHFNVHVQSVKDGGKEVKQVFERMFLEVLEGANTAG
ncbi:MAG: tape measure protein [Flavipsychrobacter sp.]|jgi:hypothetical protein|nr:tape measure protein [Flavipsychrobacter sp.]